MNNGRNIVLQIAKKEVLEFVRDWRTILAIIIIPLLLFPVLFIAFPLLLQSEADELDSLAVNVSWQGDYNSELNDILNQSEINFVFEDIPSGIDNLSTPSTDLERVRNQDIDAILRLTNDSNQWEFAVLYLSTSESSNEARNRILDSINEWESQVVNGTLIKAGLDPNETLDPIKWDGDWEYADTATKGEQAGLALSLFIPLVIAIWTASSAIQPSIDMTAGERERGTLEALLSLPASRLQLLVGKWTAVAFITSIGVGLQIAGLLFAITYLASNSIIGVPEISVLAIMLMFTAVLIFAIMIVAFELALAMKAQSVKEAGTLLGPVVIMIIFPALFTQVINLDGIESFWFAIPLVNILLAMRELLLDRVITEHVIIWLISSIAYATLAALYAAKQFKREDLVASIS
ncbi:MAG: hypothetical protein CMB20_002595 [Methanobacteriota archaeon]|nr:MAG: hypothetical protein CMB20_002595 [Euryarchaeota archaeon]